MGRCAANEDLSPGGLPQALLVDGKPPLFEVLDKLTVRYIWDAPNPISCRRSPARSRSSSAARRTI